MGAPHGGEVGGFTVTLLLLAALAAALRRTVAGASHVRLAEFLLGTARAFLRPEAKASQLSFR